jgi:hypothetical protein
MKFPFALPKRPRFLAAGLTLGLVLLNVHADPVPPSWWSDYKVLIPGATPLHYGAVNQGQLKNMAVAAYEHLRVAGVPMGGLGDMTINTGTGWKLKQLVGKWVTIDDATGKIYRRDMSAPNVPAIPEHYSLTGTGPYQLAAPDPAHPREDFSAANLGMLKAVASPFYARLAEIYAEYGGYPTPWAGSLQPPEDFAAANAGQLKNVFKFDLLRDDDADGMPDVEELAFGHGPGGVGQAGGAAAGNDGFLHHADLGQKDNPAVGLSVTGYVLP